ncbi:Structural maintenance of chromosomes protein [Rhynchospora pubera]|uniref:Structural maintenance of chromosomes protein n=1 Tax=Rhynchospora pubera TaxID=906938 RepID=A0AAV8GZF5_9POAL|nr:Structural maintenance of chromosomes protein [Rhynchospora pubera]
MLESSARIGPFHKSFTAVVGPNGSGKSNVIDAMLFVFGKRAKQMRLNNISELIHNSTNHQNLDSTAVSIHFQEILDLEDGSYEVVPGSDFSMTRVAFKDNSSKYYINNRAISFAEVTKKLKGKGIDLVNNRFLILQGEVEQISLMKPKSQGPNDGGFLEYLEDIIGTKQYVERIDNAFKEEEIQQHNNELKELEALYDKYTERQEVLEKEMTKCKEDCKVYEKAEVDCIEKEKHLKQRIQKLKDKIVKLDDLLVKEEELLGEIKNRTLNETEKLRNKLAKVRVELEPWEKQLIEHKGKRDVAISQKKLLEEKHHKGHTEYLSLIEGMEGKNERISSLKNAILDGKSKLAKLEAENKNFEKKEKGRIQAGAGIGMAYAAKTVNSATRIRNEEFKIVVTLNGDLYDSDGKMSGGGKKPCGGKMGTSIKESFSAEQEVEMNVKDFSKRLEDICTNLEKHMIQIQKDAVDPEKLDATLSDELLKEDCDLKRATEMVALLHSQLKEMNPNLDSIAEYRKRAGLYYERVKELNAATLKRDELKKQYDGLKKKRLDEFMVGFNIISLKLKEMYQMLTLGGDAEL